MPNIKILETQKRPMVPTSKDLSREVPRTRPAGGKPQLPLEKSYNRQGTK